MKYYDKDKLYNIMRQESSDLYGTCNELERYCCKYPKDRMALQYYTRLLIKLDRLDEAEKALKELEGLIVKARYEAQNRKEDIDKDEASLRLYRLILLTWKKRYKEAMTYFQMYQESIERTGVNTDLMIFYCKHKLEKIPKLALRSDFDYKFRQIVEYQESDFLYQMKIKYISQAEKQPAVQSEYNFFTIDFPFDKIYDEVKRTINGLQLLSSQEAKRLNQSFPIVRYIFKYPECGTSKNQLVDYFIVEVLCDTDNVVKMYPSKDCENLPHFDLAHMVPASNKKKQLTRSRIAKFNERYGIQ